MYERPPGRGGAARPDAPTDVRTERRKLRPREADPVGTTLARAAARLAEVSLYALPALVVALAAGPAARAGVILAVAGTAVALLAGDARGVAWPAPTRWFGRRVGEGAAVVGGAGLVGVGVASLGPGAVVPAAVAAGVAGVAGGTALGRRWESAATRGRAFLPAAHRGLVADGGNSPSGEPTDTATESRKLRRVVDEGAGSLGRNVFHGFWEVMILALPAHLYVLAFLGNPVAERTAATFAYPAAIAAAGVLRGGHVSVGAEWPDHLGWGVPARLVAYNLALALGIDLGIVVILGVHWVVGAAVATVVPVALVASVPYLAAVGDRVLGN